MVGDTTDESDGEHGDDSGSEAEPEIDPIQEHVNMMLEMVYRRKITAQDFRIAMYWLHRGGVEQVARWAKRPGLPTGHYNRHLKTRLGYKTTGQLY